MGALLRFLKRCEQFTKNRRLNGNKKRAVKHGSFVKKVGQIYGEISILSLKTVTTKEAQPQKPPWRNVNLVHDKTWVKNTGVPTITPSYFLGGYTIY